MGPKSQLRLALVVWLVRLAGNNPDISIKSVVFSHHSLSVRVILQADLLYYIISLVESSVHRMNTGVSLSSNPDHILSLLKESVYSGIKT